MNRARETARHRRGLRMIARRWWVLVLASGAMWLATGTAFAGWGSSDASDQATIHAGDLSIAVAPLTWECPDQVLTGDAGALADLVLEPGQTLILRQEVSATAVGANMRVALGVGLAGLPAGAAATWHVEAGGQQVAPASGEAPLSATLAVPADDAWTVVVTLIAPSAEPAWVDPTGPAAAPPVALGVLTITAHQVRCGDGFAAACSDVGTGAGNA